jgi:hypothetical protein
MASKLQLWWEQQITYSGGAVLIAAVVLFAVFIACFCNRYHMVPGEKGVYMYNGITGQTWYVWGNTYFPCNQPTNKP